MLKWTLVTHQMFISITSCSLSKIKIGIWKKLGAKPEKVFSKKVILTQIMVEKLNRYQSNLYIA